MAHLQVHLRVPVTVIQDDNVCSVQVDAQATRTGGKQEDEFFTALLIVGVNLSLSVLSRCVACTAQKGLCLCQLATFHNAGNGSSAFCKCR